MAYTIMINEAQRIALLELMRTVPHLTKSGGPGSALEEDGVFVYWPEMLEEIATGQFKDDPNMVHGFCL